MANIKQVRYKKTKKQKPQTLNKGKRWLVIIRFKIFWQKSGSDRERVFFDQCYVGAKFVGNKRHVWDRIESVILSHGERIILISLSRQFDLKNLSTQLFGKFRPSLQVIVVVGEIFHYDRHWQVDHENACHWTHCAEYHAKWRLRAIVSVAHRCERNNWKPF